MWKFFYNISLSIYKAGIALASNSNPKAHNWIEGRKNMRQQLEEQIPATGDKVWVHCASLGEFEQGRPVIESIKRDYPHIFIILTFFSPSGYEAKKNYALAEGVFYLPIDSARNAKFFLDSVNPKLAIFIKNEFWYYYFRELKKRGIPLLLVSSVIRKDQPFFSFYGKLHKQMLGFVTWFFVQDNMSGKLLEKLGHGNYSVITDTRIDRVADLAQDQKEIPDVDEWLNGSKLLIGGSVYEKEIELIMQQQDILLRGWKIILAPPDVDAETIRQVMWQLNEQAVAYSEFDPAKHGHVKILVIDSVGLLNKLYKYATVAVIGGGFFKAIHNILEPAAFGVPVIFGPKHYKFKEAAELIASNAAFCVYNQETFIDALKKLVNDSDFRKSAGMAAKAYINMNMGGTAKVMEHIAKHRLLPPG